MKRIIELLQSKGYKMTPQSRTVIKALFKCGQFPTAQDILEYAKTIHPDMGIDTIYRNLNLLTEIGVVHQINMRNRDASVFELVTSHHHHLVCLGCGKTECLDYCPIAEDSEKMALEKGFEIVGHSLEFYGYCCKCRAS